MYASIPQNRVSNYEFFRWFARATGALLFVMWVLLVVDDLNGEANVTNQGIVQAAALATVFVGYAIGWRKELAGGAIAIFGTVLYFAVCVAGFGRLPGLATAFFALPGVLYMLAWFTSRRYGKLIL
jgi:hypothetical protein